MTKNSIAGSAMFKTLKVAVVHNVSNMAYYGPEPALVEYLKQKNIAALLYVQHPNYGDFASKAKYYEANMSERILKLFSPRARQHWLPTAIYNALSTIFFVLNTNSSFHIYIGSGELNAFVGLILKKSGRVEKVVFLSHSFDEIRNPIITSLISRCARSADFVWGLSHRLVQIWNMQGLPEEANTWVPVGVRHEDIQKPLNFPRSSDTKKIVFVGVLSAGKGVELIIQAMPIILRRIPNVQLVIVGGGPLENELKLTCRQLGIEGDVEFKGYLEYQKLMEFLPLCHLGLAPYEPISGNTAFTTDPLKPKLYMACGLPVIITDFPETATEIRNGEAGLVIHYDAFELANAVIRLLTDAELFERCSSNAINVASKYEWDNIFNRALSKASLIMSK